MSTTTKKSEAQPENKGTAPANTPANGAPSQEAQKPVIPVEVQIIQAKSAAEFAMTQAGQYVKQFEAIQRKGMMFAQSTIVPDSYRGNVGNCIIALEMAERMGAVPLMVMQNLYVVHGNPAFSSKFLIACINASKRFSPLRFEFKGEEGKPSYGCRCYAYEASDKEHKEPLYGDWITMEMAQKEGWTSKQGSKWVTMPNQMLRYRAAAFWQRVYCPEISMGLLTAEEMEDSQYTDYVEVQSSQIAEEARRKSKENMSRVAEAMNGGAPANVDPETGEIKNPDSNSKK